MEKSTKELLEHFFSAYSLQKYKKHESVIREGDPFEKIYFLTAGLVRLYSLTKNGKEISFHIYTPGEVFPTFVTLSQEHSPYYFEALTPVDVHAAPIKKYKQFEKQSPSLSYDLTKRAGEIMEKSFQRMEKLVTESSYNNTCTALSYLSSIYETKKGSCEIPFSHQEISSWINGTRETVTRQIQKLAKKKIVRCSHRNIVVPNVKKLEAEIE